MSYRLVRTEALGKRQLLQETSPQMFGLRSAHFAAAPMRSCLSLSLPDNGFVLTASCFSRPLTGP
jgi:hypothetical protein